MFRNLRYVYGFYLTLLIEIIVLATEVLLDFISIGLGWKIAIVSAIISSTVLLIMYDFRERKRQDRERNELIKRLDILKLERKTMKEQLDQIPTFHISTEEPPEGEVKDGAIWLKRKP